MKLQAGEYKVTLTTADGEVLDSWIVANGTFPGNTLDMQSRLACAELCRDISSEIAKRELREGRNP